MGGDGLHGRSSRACKRTCAARSVCRAPIEERFELRDRAEASGATASFYEDVVTRDSVVVDGRLQIAQRGKLDFATVDCSDNPNIRARGGHCASHLELVTARGALDRCAALGNERVIEVVHGTAALAGDFHEAPESFPCRASEGNKSAGIWCAPTLFAGVDRTNAHVRHDQPQRYMAT